MKVIICEIILGLAVGISGSIYALSDTDNSVTLFQKDGPSKTVSVETLVLDVDISTSCVFTWQGTPPSGTLEATMNVHRVGRKVELWASGKYSVAGNDGQFFDVNCVNEKSIPTVLKPTNSFGGFGPGAGAGVLSTSESNFQNPTSCAFDSTSTKSWHCEGTGTLVNPQFFSYHISYVTADFN